jgi:hypothetical protein
MAHMGTTSGAINSSELLCDLLRFDIEFGRGYKSWFDLVPSHCQLMGYAEEGGYVNFSFKLDEKRHTD